MAAIAALLDETRSRAAADDDATSPPRVPPLLINTCGWVSGLGAQLLADILSAAQPTHVVSLHKADGSDGGGGAAAVFGVPLPTPATHAAGGPPPPTLLRLSGLPGAAAAQAAGEAGRPAAPPAAEARAMQLLAYLGALPAGARGLPGDATMGYMEASWQVSLALAQRQASPSRSPHPAPHP